MPSVLDALDRGKPFLWLDADAYAGRLLGPGGLVPWLDAGAFVAWQRKAQGLLKSDAVALDAAAVVAALLVRQPVLRQAMAAKTRTLFPLKVLLADAGLRALLTELLNGLRASFPATPLALRLPSPRRWIGLASGQAGNEVRGAIERDDVDSAAMYLADFLRSFGDCRLDILLLEEDAGSDPSSADDLADYQPTLNVASHYRWTTGLKLASDSAFSGAARGFDFVVSVTPLVPRSGVLVGESFWTGGPPPAIPKGGFLFAQIPEKGKPESILDRLRLLR